MTLLAAVDDFLEEGMLLSPEVVSSSFDSKAMLEGVKSFHDGQGPSVLNQDIMQMIEKKLIQVDWIELDKMKVVFERSGKREPYNRFLESVFGSESAVKIEELKKEIKTIETVSGVKILKAFEAEQKKIELKDFVNVFKSRYDTLRKMLQVRAELQNVSSITRLSRSTEKEVSVIGLVYDKTITKNGNVLLHLEDATGHIRGLINKSSTDLFKLAETICLDEVIGVVGTLRDNFLFVKTVLFPEIFNSNEKRCDEEIYAAFISDIHVGSTMFLENEFRKFIRWLNGQEGDELQKKIGLSVRYLFIVGDLVDGIGVFPNQEKYLKILDIREQYNAVAGLLKEIRPDIKIIICPGQHDSIRVAEPQPALDKDFAEALWNLPHVQLVSNPALVNVHSKPGFEGYNVLMYHGASFHYYIDSIPLLRANNARDNPSCVLKLLLQKRHLAPAYSSTIYVPTNHEDALVISQAPDVFVCGDMHRSDVSHYNGVLTVNCSCWQSKTDFQEKTGNNPDPCKVPLLNFKTKQITVVSFDS